MTGSPDEPDAAPPFTPVPTRRARHDRWTPARQRAFLIELARHGGVSTAARVVGMTAQTANRLRRRPGAESFAWAWDVAIETGRLGSFDEAVARGRDGG